MSAARCLASASLLTRSAAGQAHRLLRPASLLPWIASPVSQQQRPAAAHRLRVLSTAAPWSEDKKINVYADYTIYKVGPAERRQGCRRAAETWTPGLSPPPAARSAAPPPLSRPWPIN